MLSGDFFSLLPGVKGALDKLDSQKAKFLSIPSNVRAALDKLGRLRMLVSKNGPVTVEFAEVAQVVEQNLKMTQLQWETAADRFSQLDSLRRTAGFSLSGDTILLASQLLTSSAYVISSADKNIAAVDKLAEKYLTAEQRDQLAIRTVGVAAGMSLPMLALVGLVAYRVLRRR